MNDQVDQAVQVDFPAFFRSEYAGMVKAIGWITGDYEMAREACQEAFIRLLMRWHKVSRYEHPVAWTRKVAIRIASKESKRRSREVSGDLPEIGEDKNAVGMVLDVRRAIDELTPMQRSAVLLHYFYDLPMSEVANELGCKESTAKVHLHNARESLRQTLSIYASDA